MTADRARGALAVLQDADGKFICEVPCGYIVEQTASAHKPRRIQAQRRRRAMLRRRVALTVALLTVAALLAALMPWSGAVRRTSRRTRPPERLKRYTSRPPFFFLRAGRWRNTASSRATGGAITSRRNGKVRIVSAGRLKARTQIERSGTHEGQQKRLAVPEGA